MKRIHILLLVLVVILGVFLWQALEKESIEPETLTPPEIKALIEKYGPKLYSQHFEELLIRDFFNDQKNGIFVDVGAGHYKINSTTYYLEKHLGWRGIAIDAIARYEKEYLLSRKNTQFYSFYVADKSDEEIDFYIIERNKRLSTGNVEAVRKQGKFEKVKVLTITLDDLLEREGISQFGFLSMDIELAEPAALAGFDIDKYKPSLVCIEAHEPVLEQILDYFSNNNYEVIERYKGLDLLNLYFMPKKQ